MRRTAATGGSPGRRGGPRSGGSPEERKPADDGRRAISTRRRFLGAALAGAFGIALRRRSLEAAGKESKIRYEGLETDRYLGEMKTETRVKDRRVFTEGPAFSPGGDVFFTNIPVEKIHRWDPRARKLSVFREKSHEANGLLFDPDGRLLACEGGAGRVTRTDLATGEIEVLAGEYREKPLAPPNDLSLDRRGRLYFTSRPGPEDPEKGNVNSVYRLDPDGTLEQILRWPRVHMPNGIVLSPDERTLYLVEAHPDEGRHRDIRAYDVTEEGRVENERVLIDFYPGRSGDGMCIDREGNLYIAAGLHARRGTSETLDTRPGIHVVTPEGKLVAFRETPEDTITNCAFGGEDLRTLYITCGTYLLSCRTEVAGVGAR